MKYFLPICFVILSFLLVHVQKAEAATLNCGIPFPNEVACFDSGLHGIAGDSTTYSGFDLVFKTGYNNFLQIFQGKGNGNQVEKKSLWIPVTNGKCFPGWTYIPDAHGSGWGDYFTTGVNYCVFTL